MTNEQIQMLDVATKAGTPGDWTPDSHFGFSVQCDRLGLDRLLVSRKSGLASNSL